MKVFIVARDKHGVTAVFSAREQQTDRIGRVRTAFHSLGREVHTLIGSDLRDVVLSNPAVFEETNTPTSKEMHQ